MFEINFEMKYIIMMTCNVAHHKRIKFIYPKDKVLRDQVIFPK